MCYNTNVKGGKSVFDHGAFLVNGVSDSGFTALFDINVSFEMFSFMLLLSIHMEKETKNRIAIVETGSPLALNRNQI